ncbi:helix-turn-helix domain-containing protein, partial [Massilia pinisoli]
MLNAMSSLPFWEGHIVDAVQEQEDGSLLIVLETCPVSDALCGSCRQPCVLVHERRRRRVRDRDILDRRVWLDVPVRRLNCHHCDARVAEHIAWLDRRARITHRVRLWVEALAQLLPIAHIARLTGLHWHTIKEIDHRRLQHLHGNFSAEG